MKIIATSDLHGHLPEIPECDLLLIAGDICPTSNHNVSYQRDWLNTRFAYWANNCPARAVVATWGNHDFAGERGFVPDCRATFLVDREAEVLGLKIWGSPWQRRYYDWAFNLDMPELNAKGRAIPPVDIIVSHGPVFGYGDVTNDGHTGSAGLLETIIDTQPKLVVFGHIHPGFGQWRYLKTIIANVSYLDNAYMPTHGLVEFEL